MALNLTTGLEGIRQANYRVYVASSKDSTLSVIRYLLDGLSGDEVSVDNVCAVKSAIPLLTPIGEFRKDSIEITGEEGESIEGNESGEIPLSKECSFTAELINTTAKNIKELQYIAETSKIALLLEEIDGVSGIPHQGSSNMYEYEDMHRYIIIANVNAASIEEIGVKLNVSEQSVGGDVPRATLNVKLGTGRVSNFREIRDIVLDAVTFGAFRETDGIIPKPPGEVNYFTYFNTKGLFVDSENKFNVVPLNPTITINQIEIDTSRSSVPAKYFGQPTGGLSDGSFRLDLNISGISGITLQGAGRIRFRFKPEATISGLYSMWLSAPIGVINIT